MRRIGRRITELVFFILFLSFVSFVLMKLAPGDAVRKVLHAEDVALDQATIDAQRQAMGLDRPIWEQYFDWLTGLFHLDLGQSYMTHRPVVEELFSRMPATLLLTGTSILIMIAIAIPIGIISALNSHRFLDKISRSLAILGTSIPSFWLGIILIDVFSVKTGWLPSMGIGGAKHLILPSLTLGLTMAAVYVRVVRSSMLTSLQQDFVQGAKARGVAPLRVIIRHALRDALSPVLGMFGVSIGSLLGGTVVIEVLFAYPGMGKLAIDAIQNRDYPILQGYMVFLALMITVCNLMMDIIQMRLVPEIRLRGGKR
ncbi:nickel ABC transporter permease [Bacillus sp. B1-b2]|uniref:nickel ABC transporter permease n=1 Tax=Bacillus sp. B1-b2 TaxID=2653201 RepID=UPI00126275EF|nr:nickel ABC transporter permease [Bacillus sp. B1-b2]KAB7667126.1 ABC transporter permease [Bacillus sp. B1-b2]